MLPSPSYSLDHPHHIDDRSPCAEASPLEMTVYRPRLSEGSLPHMTNQYAILEPVRVKIAPETAPEEAEAIRRMCEFNKELRLIAELLQGRTAEYERQNQQRHHQQLQQRHEQQQYLASKASKQEETPANSDKVSIYSHSRDPSHERTYFSGGRHAEIRDDDLPEPSSVEKKYSIRMLYIKNMRVFPFPYMDKVLQYYSIDDLEIYHVNYALPEVCEIFVSARDAKTLARRLQRCNKSIFRCFDPLHMSPKSKVTLDVKKAEYRKRLLTSYHKSESGNFRRFLKNYTYSLGIPLGSAI